MVCFFAILIIENENQNSLWDTCVWLCVALNQQLVNIMHSQSSHNYEIEIFINNKILLVSNNVIYNSY